MDGRGGAYEGGWGEGERKKKVMERGKCGEREGDESAERRIMEKEKGRKVWRG